MLKLQIVFPDGTNVAFPMGSNLEIDLVEAITNKICSGRYTVTSKKKVRSAVQAAVYDFKATITRIPIQLHG